MKQRKRLGFQKLEDRRLLAYLGKTVEGFFEDFPVSIQPIDDSYDNGFEVSASDTNRVTTDLQLGPNTSSRSSFAGFLFEFDQPTPLNVTVDLSYQYSPPVQLSSDPLTGTAKELSYVLRLIDQNSETLPGETFLEGNVSVRPLLGTGILDSISDSVSATYTTTIPAGQWTFIHDFYSEVHAGEFNDNNYGTGMEISFDATVKADFRTPKNIEVSANRFTNVAARPELLVFEFSLHEESRESFVLQFAESDDLQFQSSDTEVYSATINESLPAGVTLRNENGDSLVGNQLLLTGEYTLTFDLRNPSLTALGDALKNLDAAYILGMLDPDNEHPEDDESDNSAAFDGFYQGSQNHPAVVRSGRERSDTVVIEERGSEQESRQVTATLNGSAVTFPAPSEVRVITGSGNDIVYAEASVSTPMIVTTGDGNDIVVGGLGPDEINGGDGFDFLAGEGLGLNIASMQQAGLSLENCRLQLATATLASPGGDADVIRGGEGYDILIGGPGSDQLFSGPGPSLIFGDAFIFEAGVNFNFCALFDSVTNPIRALGKAFELSVGSAGDGNGDDIIVVEDSTNVVFGGAGDDLIEGLSSDIDLFFGQDGDDFLIASDTSRSVLFGGDDDDYLSSGGSGGISVGGDGNDDLLGSSEADLLIGDEIRVTLNDSSFLDGIGTFLEDLVAGKISFRLQAETFGSGEDELYGFGGIDFLIGGGSNDILNGGDGGGLIVGDNVHFGVGPEELKLDSLLGSNEDESSDPGQASETTQIRRKKNSQKLFDTALKLIGTPTFELKDSGDDQISGGLGFDLVFGGEGKDQVDSGGGFSDVVFGNAGDDIIKMHSTYFAIAVGGEGSDQLEASTIENSLGSVLIGDTFDFLGIPVTAFDIFRIDFDGLFPSRFVISLGAVHRGKGNDILKGANGGFNMLIGGDGNDTISGNGFFDLILGDSINLGNEVIIDFSEVSLFKTFDENIAAINTQMELPGLSGSGSDTITGGSNFNFIVGGGGVDVITGGSGPLDVVFGGSGADRIDGKDGFNFIVGGEGSDNLVGGNDANILIGDGYRFDFPGLLNLVALKEGRFVGSLGLAPVGSGRDTLTGGDGFDLLIGGHGDDIMHGGNGFNIALGDAFTINTSGLDLATRFGTAVLVNVWKSLFGTPTSFLQEIAESLGFQGSGADTYHGGNDVDVVFGGDGMDTINGGAGFDFLVGGGGDDLVNGQEAGDFVLGGPGDDVLFGGLGNDHLESEGGDDVFIGGEGDDEIFAGDGDDLLFGGPGNDTLHGEGDSDLLDGGAGTDAFFGGSDIDTLFELESGEQSDQEENEISDSRAIILRGSGETLDLSSNATAIDDVTTIDIRGIGANQLVLDAERMNQFALNDILIRSNSDDKLSFDPNWEFAGATFRNGKLVRNYWNKQISISIRGPRTFSNPQDARDVNADHQISALDALNVINQLSRRTFVTDSGRIKEESEISVSSLGDFQFLDVNGDARISALDALLVINALAATPTADVEIDSGLQISGLVNDLNPDGEFTARLYLDDETTPFFVQDFRASVNNNSFDLAPFDLPPIVSGVHRIYLEFRPKGGYTVVLNLVDQAGVNRDLYSLTSSETSPRSFDEVTGFYRISDPILLFSKENAS